jgi:hypothetical protein
VVDHGAEEFGCCDGRTRGLAGVGQDRMGWGGFGGTVAEAPQEGELFESRVDVGIL